MSSEKLFCLDCNIELPDGKIYCPKCGLPGSTVEECDAYQKKQMAEESPAIDNAEASDETTGFGTPDANEVESDSEAENMSDSIKTPMPSDEPKENPSDKTCGHSCHCDEHDLSHNTDDFNDCMDDVDEELDVDLKTIATNAVIGIGLLGIGIALLKLLQRKK